MDVAKLLRGRSESKLARRAPETNRSALELVCYVRDLEEIFVADIKFMLDRDDPSLVDAPPIEQWTEERQYRSQHVGDAWNTLSRRRDELLELLRTLDETRWQRIGVHPERGRLTIDDVVSLIAWHDEDYVERLRRTLDG
jgi:DinB family protein